jgi:hypothetical protein
VRILSRAGSYDYRGRYPLRSTALERISMERRVDLALASPGPAHDGALGR